MIKNLVENLVNGIDERLAEKRVKIVVGIDCESINLHTTTDLKVYGIEMKDNEIYFNDNEMGLHIGLNYTNLTYDEYEEEYTFEYAKRPFQSLCKVEKLI